MSRIGKLPISIPAGVKVEIEGNLVKVSGPKGNLSQDFSSNISVEVKDNQVHVSRLDDTTDSNAKQGLYRQLINNMVIGVKDGFKKSLAVKGVGYKLNKKGQDLSMNLGFSHPVEFKAPEGISFDIPDNNTIIVNGIDKALVGETAAKIKALRPVEPYHGYGIHYSTEQVIQKQGKASGKKK